MSFLFHFGDLLLDGKDPVDDSVDKIVIIFESTIIFCYARLKESIYFLKLSTLFLPPYENSIGVAPSSSCCCSLSHYSRSSLRASRLSASRPPILRRHSRATSIPTAGLFLLFMWTKVNNSFIHLQQATVRKPRERYTILIVPMAECIQLTMWTSMRFR